MKARNPLRTKLLKAASYAQTFSTVGAALAGLRERPTILNAVGIAATVFGNVATHIKDGGVATMMKGWKFSRLSGVNISAVLLPFFVETLGDWRFYHVGTQGVAQHERQPSDWVHVEKDVSLFSAELRQHTWTTCSDAIQMVPTRSEFGPAFELGEYPQGPVHESEKSAQVWARLRPFIEAGEARSILLDGPPGVGKSTIVHSLTRKIRGRVLRVPVAELDNLSPTMLVGLASFLRPEVIVIDDFDRAYGQTKMLDFFEQARTSYRLLIVTTNSLEHIDPAVTRPGRFDELMRVSGLGDTYVRAALGTVWERLSSDDRSKVATWPAAYLAELRKRDDRIAGIVLADEVAELNARVLRKKVPEWAAFMDSTPPGATPKG